MTQDLIKKMREEYAKQQEEKLIQEQVEQIKLEANAAPTPSATNTPQAVLDRTVATIKKVNEVKASGSLQVRNFALIDDVKVNISTMDGTTAEKTLVAQDYVDSSVALLTGTKADKSFESVKDISSATTQAEVYALLEVGKTYNWHGSIIRCFDKQPSQAMVRGFGVTNTNEFAMIGIWVHNTADPFTITVPADLDRLSVYTPSSDNHATNKKYVDAGLLAKANADLKVWANDGTAHNLSEMDGTTADKTLITRQFNATKLAAKQDTLTRTLTLVLDDNTTTDIKVG